MTQWQHLPPSVRSVEDVTPGRWIEERVWPWTSDNASGVRLGSMMPEGFPCYARILHPAESVEDSTPLRWADVAAREGKRMHPLVQCGRLAGKDDPYGCPDWAHEPGVGELPEEETRAVVGILRQFTTTPDQCLFGVWDGWGFLDSSYQRKPRISVPHRDFLLFAGPLEAVLEFADGANLWRTPSLWWPADRAWFVATDIDLMDTYVGGSGDCIKQVRDSPALEALAFPIEGRVDFYADTINV